MKIIFLDIDGVLNVIGQGRDEFGQTFHKHFEDNLRWIIEQTGAKIVISSTWRLSGIDVMQRMWKKRGLAGDVIDITPIVHNVIRGIEIQHWIDEHSITYYCIIDDDNDMLTSQKNNFVRTSGNKDHPDCVDIGYGLTRKCAERVVEILNGVKL
jgi:hypothetical protein